MITDAALYLAGPDDARVARSVVAARPLALRALVAAVRAGCRRVFVPAVLREPRLEAAIARRPSVRAAVAWVEAAAPPPDRPLVLVPVCGVMPPGALAPLLAAGAPATLAAAEGRGAPVASVGPSVVGPLWEGIIEGRPVGDALQVALKDEAAVPVVGGWFVRVGGPGDVAEAERRLWASLGSAIDTRLDRVFHRRLSRPLSRLAVAAGIGPNAVTLASLVVGLAAVAAFWLGTPATALAGLALYAAAVVLDHADGEVARVTLTESPAGGRLDVVVDTTIHAALVLALGLVAQRLSGGWGALAGAVAAAGVVGSAVVTTGSPALAGRGVGTAIEALSNRDGFYAMLLLFVAALALWPAALTPLMVFVAAGCHGFWLARLVYAVTRRR